MRTTSLRRSRGGSTLTDSHQHCIEQLFFIVNLLIKYLRSTSNAMGAGATLHVRRHTYAMETRRPSAAAACRRPPPLSVGLPSTRPVLSLAALASSPPHRYCPPLRLSRPRALPRRRRYCRRRRQPGRRRAMPQRRRRGPPDAAPPARKSGKRKSSRHLVMSCWVRKYGGTLRTAISSCSVMTLSSSGCRSKT